jgi:PAS domain S-box-containing protein
VAHTHEVLGSLYLLVSSLQEAEAGQRGYILSGKEEYLGPYYHSATRIAGQLGQLRTLTAGDPAQGERVKLLFGIAARSIGVLNEGIAARRTRGLDSAIAVILTGQGKLLMDSARSTVYDMQAIERNLLRVRSRKSEILARRTELTIMLASSLGLLLLVTSAFLANWEIRVRRAAEAGLQQANEGLEDRVAGRTKALESLNEALRGTRDELQALVEAAPVAIIGIDPEGIVVSWHGGAQAMFGWSAAEVIGGPLLNVPPDKQEEFRALRDRVLRGDSFTGFEARRVCKDGSLIDVSISTAPLHDGRGHIVGIIGAYQDISERRLIAEQRQAREAADAANLAKSNFLANMSQELRTPLNAIIGFSELLEDRTFGELNERQQRYVTNVLSGGRHLLQLVNDILDLAKIEAGRLLVEPEPIDLGMLLQDMQRGLEPLAAAKHQTMTVEFGEDVPILMADRGKVKQILYNLLSNAIKFTKDGGRIGMRASAAQSADGAGQVLVSVWDTGIGIAAEDLQRIFLEFEQLDSTYARQQQGTGLGLALTRRLVEAHGGRLTAESVVGQGSTFTFVLPAMPGLEGAAPRQPTSVRLKEPRPQGPLVLVVEDDNTSRELLSHYLVASGYSVCHAGTAAKALETARLLRPAAISLDMLLPDGHGLELLARLHGDPMTKEIPVVVVSIVDDRESGFNAGAAAWLVKPVQRQQFIDALDHLGLTPGRPGSNGSPAFGASPA